MYKYSDACTTTEQTEGKLRLYREKMLRHVEKRTVILKSRYFSLLRPHCLFFIFHIALASNIFLFRQLINFPFVLTSLIFTWIKLYT